jgi:hypothetical protein
MKRDGRPKRPINIVLEEEQCEILELIAELSPVGKPSLSSIVRKAVELFISGRLDEDPALRERVEKRRRARLVSIAGLKNSAE